MSGTSLRKESKNSSSEIVGFFGLDHRIHLSKYTTVRRYSTVALPLVVAYCGRTHEVLDRNAARELRVMPEEVDCEPCMEEYTKTWDSIERTIAKQYETD